MSHIANVSRNEGFFAVNLLRNIKLLSNTENCFYEDCHGTSMITEMYRLMLSPYLTRAVEDIV